MEINHFLHDNQSDWMNGDEEHGDIIMSTRIRLARNMNDYRFPRAFDEDEALTIDREVSSALLDAENLAMNFSYFDVASQPILEKQILVEKHLISPQLAKKEKAATVLLSEDGLTSVMVNEEDHIRIQCLEPGLKLKQALEKANQIDDHLEKKIDYAFDERFGYITCCPTNVGTGLRASVMMHLPALTLTNQMRPLINMMPRLGLVVRGIYGEGTEALGNYYQISNQITLGKSEEEIVQDLQVIVEQIFARERQARNAMLERVSVAVADKAFRALGILQNARVLTSQEGLNCLSNIRLGIDLGIIQSIPNEVLNKCMLMMQPGFLQYAAGNMLKANERDIYRATRIREIIYQTYGHQNGDKGEDLI